MNPPLGSGRCPAEGRADTDPDAYNANRPLNTLMRHPRHFIAWFCLAASLWMGVEFRLHGLTHALHALDAVEVHEGEPASETVCEQCLLFASVDGAMASRGPVLEPGPATQTAKALSASGHRVSPFTAYESRAPPALA